MITPLQVRGAWLVAPRVSEDDRGCFREMITDGEFRAATGEPFTLAQANISQSRHGVIRGIHFTAVPPGQVKYVTCTEGRIMDVVVDVRPDSPALGAWSANMLTPGSGGVLISEGLGHAWMALTRQASLAYLCTRPYSPGAERAVHPLDPAIGIRWPGRIILSPRDAAAPSLKQALGA